MSIATSAFNLDANRNPITGKGLIATKTIAYDGTENKGAAGATTLFTVTGTVIVTVFGVCTEDLVSAGGGTVEIGIAGNTAALIAQTTATNIDNGEIWVDNAPATVEAPVAEKILTAGTDIIETIGTGDVTNGTVTYYCLWYPVSSDGDVVAA